jgi:hypothetical protein
VQGNRDERERVAKREGLAMGTYRGDPNQSLPAGIKWAQEGGWCVSIVVPLGNDLNEP